MIVRTTLFLSLVLLHQGLGQNQTEPTCTPIETRHACFSIPARNSEYRFPQLLPEDVEISSNSVMLSFVLLNGGSEPPDPDCVSALMHVVCLAARPPCDNNTELLLPICPDSCAAYMKLTEEGKCNSLLEYGQELVMSPQSIEVVQVLIGLLLQLDCFNSSTYYFYNESFIGSDTCTNLFTTEDKERVLSTPNQCVPVPTDTVCDSVALSRYNHYVPLQSRNVSINIDLLEGLRQNDDISSNCTNILISLGCYLTFPPCDPDTMEALPLCLEDCEATNDLIQSCIAMVMSDGELDNLVRQFNCSNVGSYLPSFVHENQSMCINGTIFDQLAELNPASGEVVVGVIAGAAVGGVSVLIVVTVLVLVGVVFLYKRKSRKLNLLGYDLSISMRKSRAERTYSEQPGSPTLPNIELKASSEKNGEMVLSAADKESYEKVFSSILVPYATLTVGEVIGQGAFGKVHKGELKQPSCNESEAIAIKTIKHLNSRDELEAFFDESLLMKDFHHPNILGLTGVCFDTPDGVPFILLPFMANGSLKDYLKKKRTHVTNVDTLPEGLSLSVLVRMCMDVASGMEYLAGEKFVHRDLAARNCMVDVSLAVRVGDFGLARDVYSSDYYRANAGARLPVKWMAPETLHDAISNEKTDVWSFGVTCWEVFSLGRSPYPGIQNQDILKHISNNERLERPSLCPEMLYDLTMSQCWKVLPEERPTFSQLAHQLHEYWEEEHAYVVEELEEPHKIDT